MNIRKLGKGGSLYKIVLRAPTSNERMNGAKISLRLSTEVPARQNIVVCLFFCSASASSTHVCGVNCDLKGSV